VCRKISDIALHENWMIGLIDQPIENAIRWTECPPVRWIGPRTQKRYFADPFAWPGQGGDILCEDYDIGTRIGRLVRLEMDGASIRRETPLNVPLPGHLSFPFIFMHENNIYLMPESAAARRLSIFQWQEQTKTWREFTTPLPNAAAADGILFEHGGMFWIAYTDLSIDRFDNLNLCYAPSLDGPWRKHPLNPVKRDIRSSRCAGPVFMAEGRLYRPAQDCASSYGSAIRIMEIVECTPTTYREKEVALLRPAASSENPHGLHTLSPYGDKCLVDGKRMMFSPRIVLEKAMRRLRRIVGYKAAGYSRL
jgi:hypothetical protein